MSRNKGEALSEVLIGVFREEIWIIGHYCNLNSMICGFFLFAFVTVIIALTTFTLKGHKRVLIGLKTSTRKNTYMIIYLQ